LPPNNVSSAWSQNFLCGALHNNRYFGVSHSSYLPDDWLTVHRSITLVDLQLDAQNSYLFAYNTFIKILHMFRALPCLSSGGLRRNYIYAASGIVTCAGYCLVHRLTGAQDSHLHRVRVPEAAYTQLRRRLPEDEQGNVRNM